MTNTLLAAIHAAANGPDDGGEPVPITAALIKTHAPAVAAELAAEGVAQATAKGAADERLRIEGIRAAAFPGQDALATELIADGKTTPGEAGLRFITAQKSKLTAQAQAIFDNDQLVSEVKPSPVATVSTAKSKASTPEGWKDEWAGSEKLQKEFTSADLYAAHMKYEARKEGVAA